MGKPRMSKLDEIEARFKHKHLTESKVDLQAEKDKRLLIRAVRELDGALLEAEKHAQTNSAFKGLFRRLRMQLDPDVLELTRG